MKKIYFIILFIIIFIFILLEYYDDQNIEEPYTKDADIIILGGGTAGCVMGRRMADKYPDKKVLILERGIDRHNDKNVYDLNNAPNAVFTDEYSESINTSDDYSVTVGRILGGGSSRNYGLAVVGSMEFYKNNWLTILGLSPKDLIEYTKKVENYSGDTQVTSDRDTGKIHTSPFETEVLIITKILPFILLLPKLGFPEWLRHMKHSIDVYNRLGPLRTNDNFSNEITNIVSELKQVHIVEDYNYLTNNYSNVTSKIPQVFVNGLTGLRSSSDVSYLPHSYIRKDKFGNGRSDNLSIRTNAFINKIVVIDGDVICVSWKDNITHLSMLNTGGKIISCLGGLMTPFILQKSGIGNEKIGKDMLNHYGCQLIFKMSGKEANFSLGPVSFVSKDKGIFTRDWQFLFSGDASVNKDLLDKVGIDIEKERRDDPNTKYISILLWLLHPKSRGSVTNKNDEIEIKLNMLDDNEDETELLEAIKFLKVMMDKARLKFPTIEIVYPAINDFNNDSKLKERIRESLSITEHYSGTCKLEDSVDPKDFSVIGFPNIHVVDTSVFPAIPDGNTCFPTYLMAEIAADRVIFDN